MGEQTIGKVVENDFSSVFEIISRRRSRALMAVNVELLMTYWEIGAFLSPRIHSGSWSTSVVGQLADYLKRQDSTLRGYGKSNLYSMALVYDTFSTDEFLALVERYSRVLRLENISQPVVGKCLTQILASMSFSNLTLIASHCHDAQNLV